MTEAKKGDFTPQQNELTKEQRAALEDLIQRQQGFQKDYLEIVKKWRIDFAPQMTLIDATEQLKVIEAQEKEQNSKIIKP